MAGDGTPGPVIVLVEPQLGENIGMAARAMLNCRLTELRLVKPRDGWPSDEATAASTGDLPPAISTVIDSHITIDVSTSMPSAMMRAASEIWLRPMSK